jgi:SAM-dependent methyltransferase
VAPFAETVFAVEPVTSLRRFIKEKATRENINNLYVMDGFLDSIPLPDSSIDVLMTSNAIGWNLEGELMEIERILKPGAYAIHLMQSDVQTENPLHDMLVSTPWNYTFTRSEEAGGMALRYYKTIRKV